MTAEEKEVAEEEHKGAEREQRRAAREQGIAARDHGRAEGEHIDELGFSGAAKRLHLSQPAVTCWPQFGDFIHIQIYGFPSLHNANNNYAILRPSTHQLSTQENFPSPQDRQTETLPALAPPRSNPPPPLRNILLKPLLIISHIRILPPSLRNRKPRHHRAQKLTREEDPQHLRQAPRRREVVEQQGGEDGAEFARRGGDAVAEAPDAGGEDFGGDDEG